MSFCSRLFRAVTTACLILTVAVFAFADTLRLKDGSIIKGKIVTFGGGKFTVAMGEGSRRKELVFLASEVDSIQFDSPGGGSQMPDVVNRNASYDEPAKTVPLVISPKVITKDYPSQPSTSASAEKMKPIEWKVKVLADNTSNGWTNSGWVVKKGQKIRITGDGKIQLGKGQTSTPSGVAAINDEQKLLKNVATGALIAVIGDDNNDFIYVGAEREFTATRDGALFLGINEGYLEDNSGSYSVKIEILPDTGN
ncbi:hypothetical protein BH10ACI2_BH10ACI2_17530 [soil metagenome]